MAKKQPYSLQSYLEFRKWHDLYRNNNYICLKIETVEAFLITYSKSTKYIVSWESSLYNDIKLNSLDLHL